MRHLSKIAVTFALLTSAAASRADSPALKPTILELGSADLDPDWEDESGEHGPTRPELVIRSDGSWWAAGVGSHQPLTRAEVRKLRAAISRTRFQAGRGDGARCLALPTQRLSLRAPGRHITWLTPCGRPPHPSVLALVALARKLTTEHVIPVPVPVPDPNPVVDPLPVQTESPILLSYRVNRYRSLGDGEFVTIRKDGSYVAGGGKFHPDTETKTGALSSAELADLLQALRAATFGGHPRPSACAAMLEGDGTLEAPGFGTTRWSVPCGQLHPSLDPVLGTVTRLLRR